MSKNKAKEDMKTPKHSSMILVYGKIYDGMYQEVV